VLLKVLLGGRDELHGNELEAADPISYACSSESGVLDNITLDSRSGR
jgi:hypothetical protein